MVSQWEALAVPFPDDEVKQRPGAAKFDHKPQCEGARCRETRDPNKHIQFSYVDARAVAQRLDDVLTPEGWDFTCATIPGSDVVKGTLMIGSSVREDHGYPNSDRDEEPIKAATSDALKRCAVLFGVGRHLYEDNRPGQKPAKRQTQPQAPQRPELERRAEGLVGTITRGASPVDLELRTETNPGPTFGFKLMAGKKGYQAIAVGPLAESLAIAQAVEDMTGQTATIWGRVEMVPFVKDGKDLQFARIAIERVQTPGWTLPAIEAETAPMFDEATR